ncbi:MAG: AAA family ATPase [Gemmatimonadaceae bacterium]
MHRIVVTGSECTGKTTLARELARFLRTDWLPEWSREYAETRGAVLTLEDVEHIARGHIAREDATLGGGRGPLVLDTDLVSTTVYSEFYYGSCAPWIREEARLRKADLYLLTAIDLPWAPDGVRDRPGERSELHNRFVRRLRELDALVLPVDGLGERRSQNAIANIRGWRAASAITPLLATG